MATIDEILDAMPEEIAETGREYLVIDPVTRTITVPGSESVFGVTGDELADRKYFMCPRYVGDGLDLAGMFIRVNYRNAGGDEDGYLVDDVAVVGDYVTFSWRLWPKVTEYKGAIQFSVCADLPNTAERRFPDWNTTMATGEVLEGLHPYDGAVEEETRDVVTQLRAETAAQTAAVTACGAEQVQAVKDTAAAETAASVAAIKAQGAATQASLPADYTTLAAQVDKLTRDRAAAIVCEAEGAAIQVQDASNDPLQGLRIFGRSTQDGTPTPDNPVEIVSTPAPVVQVCGKNLLAQTCADKTISGVTFTVNADGSITANGTSTGVFTYQIHGKLTGLQKGKKYTLTGNPSNSADYMLYFDQKDADGNNLGSCQDYGQGKTMEIAANYSHLWVGIFAQTGVTFNNLTFYPMLRLAEIEDDTYEPYTGQALTITTPGSLPGIPVASGGNYTDANGQEWICDEVDLARGVYVQRVAVQNPAEFAKLPNYDRDGVPLFTAVLPVVVEGAAEWSDNFGCCTHMQYKNVLNHNQTGFYIVGKNLFVRVQDVTDESAFEALVSNAVFYYTMAKPVETPLTDAELQAYRALQSYKPTTTVLNDAGAHMALEYAADPKTYIDNKLAALVAANN